ncbi:MAG: glycoside hydrolase family 26 protein [Janthinobacterium lividum]
MTHAITRRSALVAVSGAVLVPSSIAAATPPGLERVQRATADSRVIPSLTTDATTGTLIDRLTWGAYAPREPFPDCSEHHALEALVGTRFEVMSWFLTWSVSWPRAGGLDAAAGGYDVQIAWQPELDDDTPIRFADVLAGVHDDYLVRFFTRAAAHPGRVTIRFAHEMNGSGYPWSVGYRGSGPGCLTSVEEYITVWRYLVRFQRSLGARNIRWAWCITTSDKGGIPAEDYYPGSDVVDVLAADVYVGYGGGWQSPGRAVQRVYDRLTPLHPSAPVWLSELGCREPSKDEPGAPPDPRRDKARWLEEFFGLTGFPRLSAACFFNASRAFDWRLESSPGALAAARQAFERRS